MPQGFKYNYLVSIPKIKDHKGKALKYDDFRDIAISPIVSMTLSDLEGHFFCLKPY